MKGDKCERTELTKLDSDADHLPAPSQVAFGDVGNRYELVQRAVPAADTEGPGGFFLHLDLEVHLVRLHLLGQDLDRFKIVEVGQSLIAPFHRHRVGDFLLVDPETTTLSFCSPNSRRTSIRR